MGAMDYHEALAELGIGSAHPGGFASTRLWSDSVGIEPGQRVLEVGCGTGRTACELALRYGARVTALDLRPAMLAKAQERAKDHGADIVFKRVIGKRLPVADESFDWVVAESVTVFNPISKMLSEYARVLAPGGMVVDTEMCAAGLLAPEVMRAFADTYGATDVPTMSGWKELYRQGGFSDVRIVHSGSVDAGGAKQEEPDLWGLNHTSALSKEVWSIVESNQRVMSSYSQWLQYAVLVAKK